MPGIFVFVFRFFLRFQIHSLPTLLPECWGWCGALCPARDWSQTMDTTGEHAASKEAEILE